MNDSCPCSQDVQDDLEAGVRSLAFRHRSQTQILLCIGVIAQLLLIGTGGALHASELYLARMCGRGHSHGKGDDVGEADEFKRCYSKISRWMSTYWTYYQPWLCLGT